MPPTYHHLLLLLASPLEVLQIQLKFQLHFIVHIFTSTITITFTFTIPFHSSYTQISVRLRLTCCRIQSSLTHCSFVVWAKPISWTLVHSLFHPLPMMLLRITSHTCSGPRATTIREADILASAASPQKMLSPDRQSLRDTLTPSSVVHTRRSTPTPTLSALRSHVHLIFDLALVIHSNNTLSSLKK